MSPYLNIVCSDRTTLAASPAVSRAPIQMLLQRDPHHRVRYCGTPGLWRSFIQAHASAGSQPW
jgi:hypothetical protein